MRSSDNQAQAKRYFRSAARTFQMNGGWYFSTREGDQGPYRSQERAREEMVRYVRDQLELGGFQRSRGEVTTETAPHLRNLPNEKLRESAAPRMDLELDLEPLALNLAAGG